METVREVAKTVTATTSGVVDGIQTSTKTVTETLTDGTETQKKVITETYDDVVDGALVTVERVKTIAADGTEEVAETIKEASIKSFDDLWKELQTHADTGLLGTFDDLYTAVKNKDWKSIGLWAANAIYGGLTAEQKKAGQRLCHRSGGQAQRSPWQRPDGPCAEGHRHRCPDLQGSDQRI